MQLTNDTFFLFPDRRHLLLPSSIRPTNRRQPYRGGTGVFILIFCGITKQYVKVIHQISVLETS